MSEEGKGSPLEFQRPVVWLSLYDSETVTPISEQAIVSATQDDLQVLNMKANSHSYSQYILFPTDFLLPTPPYH